MDNEKKQNSTTKKRRYAGITRLQDSRIQVRVRARNARTGLYEERERKLERGTTTSEAIEVREELRQQIIAGGETVLERRRFGVAARSWLSSRLPTWKHGVRDHVGNMLDNQILPTFGDYFVETITQQDVIEWRDAQSQKTKGKGENKRPLSEVTVNSRLRLLKQVLADITAEQGIANPAARVPALRVPKSRKRKGLELHQAAAVLAKLREHEPKWYPIAYAALLTGQRWGAVSALEWEQIDWTAGIVRFDRAHVRGVVDEQKTGAVIELPLVAALRELFETQRVALRRAEKKRRERREPGTVVLETAAGLEGRWVFPSRHGTLMQPSSLRAPLRNACIAAGVPTISPHGLRYTFNHASNQVTTADVTRSITGHVTAEMTRHYDWVNNDEKAKALTNIAGRLATAPAGGSLGGVSGGVPSAESPAAL